jgi:hypothetical protein
MDYYDQFVKPKQIIKDINYFYNQIRDLICNDFYGQYLYNKRKKLKINEYAIENFLSSENNTRLRFSNDKIIVNFKVSKNERGKTLITKTFYRNYRIEGITFQIDIVITPQEEKNRIIYPQNDALIQLRKHINDINNFYVKNFRKDEESKYKFIFNRLIKVKKSYYNNWNRLVDFVTDCSNPNFNTELKKFKEIIKGLNVENLSIIYKMVHHTQFFQNHAHYRQIKYNKFLKSFRKECLDDKEIFELTKELSWCFNHNIKDYEESLIFIENLCNHYNSICYSKEMRINTFVKDIWEEPTAHHQPTSYLVYDKIQ